MLEIVSNAEPAVSIQELTVPQTVLSLRGKAASADVALRTRSNSSPRGHDKFRFGKSLCIFPASRLRRRPDRLIRKCRAKLLERQFQTKERRASPNRQLARVSRTPARNAAVKFLIRCADVDLHMFVADAASDVAAKFVTAEFAARVPIIESDFSAGPNERRFFRGQ